MLTPWHESTQALKYQLSFVTLAQKNFRFMACEVGLEPDFQVDQMEIPPKIKLTADFDGILVRGLPVEKRRETVEFKEGFIIYTPWHFERCYVDLDQPYEAYLKGFKSKTRSTIRRKVRKFASQKDKAPDFRIYRTPKEVAEFVELASEVSARTYQEKYLDVGLPTDPDFRESLLRDADADSVRGFILFYDGKPISYLLLTAAGSTLTYDYLGYDPDYQQMSPGTALHWLTMESLFAEKRFKMLDFTEGDGRQKEQFRSGFQICATIYCLKKSAQNALFVYTHVFMSHASIRLGELADRMGLKIKLKKLLMRA